MPTRDPETAQPEPIVLVVRRTIQAPAERLFRAWTEPALLMKWWGPATARCSGAELDLRVGGKYRLANTFPDGRVVFIVGAFERISPPRELVYTWRLEGVGDKDERVTVRFLGSGESTEVVVTHERIATPKMRDGHALGWEGCLDGLARYVANELKT
jgi:uncharacterized protein YndB with AHSA1/START domain